MKVRVKFSKHGPVRYIGHLDVMRFFQKAIRRAEIDVAYTSGYSPHQIMSFAAPLGVGLESNGEYMDIECHSVTSSQDMVERLNRVSVPGIRILSVRRLADDAGNAMASVGAAEYTVRWKDTFTPQFPYASEECIGEFLAQSGILVEKETKKGKREVDIRPGLYRMEALEDGGVRLLVDASSAGNIKPALVMEAYCRFHGEEMPENALWITREEIYTAELLPLEAVGMEITGSGEEEDS